MKGQTLRQVLTQAWLTADPRSLGLGRIGLALLLLFDLLRRIPDLGFWYANDGLVSNHMLLWRPPTQWMFSLFFLASWADEAALGFVLCGAAYVGLLLGWRTRVFQCLALIAVWSLHSRTTFVENGGDWMLGELTLWTAFLPLGRRFSVDAVRAARDNPGAPPDTTPVVSLAVFAVLVQLAVSYLFNALHKGGPSWRAGTAVHVVLHQDRMVTALGVWLRPHMTLLLSRLLTWGSLAMEGALPALILLPVGLKVTRRLAVVLIIALHVGLQLVINVGVFSLVMMAYAPFLLRASEWEALASWSRLGAVARRWSARAQRWVTVAFRFNRRSLRPIPTATPAVATARRWLGRAREAAVAVMLLVLFTELFIGNPLLAAQLRMWQPGWVKALVAYPRLIQAWSMFAPDAPCVDENVVVDAVTADGRHVDPYSQVAGRLPAPGPSQIPPRLDNDSFFFNYSARIPFTPQYWGGFSDWILAYPQRTGRAEDRIVRFDAYIVEDDCPPVGETQPRNTRARIFLSWPRR